MLRVVCSHKQRAVFTRDNHPHLVVERFEYNNTDNEVHVLVCIVDCLTYCC